MKSAVRIGRRWVGADQPVYIVAELSANHRQDYDQALRLLECAKQSGADAVKIQTYTPDTITLDSDREWFQIKGTIWAGKKLHQLYEDAYTPWEWQPKLKQAADRMDLDFFSSAFDFTAVDFLEEMDIPVYKVASFELVDIPLLKRIAHTGKPVILSTGMASLSEIEEAVTTLKIEGCNDIILLKCTSAYPSPYSEMNLTTIPNLAHTFNVPVGLSDHTLGHIAAVAAVALGACLVEKHMTLDRSIPGPDSAFSLEPREFKHMVESIRETEVALGNICYEPGEKQLTSRVFRRSLFVVVDMNPGDFFTENNVRSIRPSHGLHTRYYEHILGRKARKRIERGTPLHWNLIE